MIFRFRLAVVQQTGKQGSRIFTGMLYGHVLSPRVGRHANLRTTLKRDDKLLSVHATSSLLTKQCGYSFRAKEGNFSNGKFSTKNTIF